jgi:hypothetical protein
MSLDLDTLKTLAYLFSVPEPPLCPFDTLGLFHFLVEQAQDPEEIDNARHLPRILDLASGWMSLRRSPTQVRNILSSHCRCSTYSAMSTHSIGKTIYLNSCTAGHKLTPGQVLVQSCTLEMCNLRKATPILPLHKLQHLALRSSWPTTTTQLLPHGPDETVRGYMDWLAGETTGTLVHIMEAFKLVVTQAWPLAVPAIIKTHLFPGHFIDAANRWPEFLIAIKQKREKIAYDEQSRLVLSMIIHLTAVMRLVSGDCSDPTHGTVFLRPHRKDIVASCDRMIQTTNMIISQKNGPSEVGVYVTQALISVGATVYYYFPEDRNQLPQLPSHRSMIRDADMMGPSHNMTWNMFTKVLEYQHIRQTCGAPDCLRTTEHLGRRLSFCSGCLWVPYCSRRCQRDAWRRGDGLQHREVCALLRYVCVRCDISPSSKAGIWTRDAPTFVDKYMHMMEAISAHFTALSAHALAQP